jgi:hypothetical protein
VELPTLLGDLDAVVANANVGSVSIFVRFDSPASGPCVLASPSLHDERE